MSTELATREAPAHVALFNGATPREVVAAAADVAQQLADVVERQKLYQQIRNRKHVLVEGWQTLGSMTGVFAAPSSPDAEVSQLPWPVLVELGPEPEQPGKAPREGTASYAEWKAKADVYEAWDHDRTVRQARDNGKAYGFKIAFTARKDNVPVGWGEGRCTRAEKRWASAEDYAVASMAQTRAQSRALSAPLRFIVRMAGYAPTPAEETTEPGSPTSEPYGRPVDEEWRQKALTALDGMGTPEPAEFLRLLANSLDDELPEACARALVGLQWWLDREPVVEAENDDNPPDPPEE